MRYVYEFMTQAEQAPEAGSDLGMTAGLLNQKTGQMFTGALEAMEKRFNQEIDVLSHSQIVVGDKVVTTLLVRRSGASADPRRN